MNTKQRLALVIILACGLSTAHAQSFYKDPQGLVSVRPDDMKSLNNITRFGPVGLGIDLIQPAFTMRISNIEEGSPAEATGKLQKGQIIESINGQKLLDIDPRIQLGRILAAVEATDGILRFAIRGQAEEVVVNVPVLGAYSKTWPLHCPKSEKIVRGFADYLAKPGSDKGFGGVGMLFLLSTGEEKYLEPVRKWARSVGTPTYDWHLCYGGIPLTEYYLRTGDKTVLPIIQKWVELTSLRSTLAT